MVAVKKNQPATVQNTNETVRDASKMSASTGRGVVIVSYVPRKIKAAKNSSEESGRFSVKICTSENFPLYGTRLSPCIHVCVRSGEAWELSLVIVSVGLQICQYE